MMGRKQYADAQKYFRGAIKADPRNFEAYKGMGYSYVFLNDKPHAIQYLRYALQINPNDARLTQYLSQIGGGALAAGPSKSEQDYQTGIKYMQAHQYQYAAYSFNQCTTEDPNSSKGWQGLGNAFYAEAQKEKAIDAWKHALAIDPGNAQLANYVDSIEGPSSNAAPEQASASPEAPAPQAKSSGINPWIMGGTIAALGAVMLFLF